ncbi:MULTISPECIES: ABC transporter substrate-binding protein [Paraburkholderia]|uniref:ABC transporter substrate-binding protein n=1 Tax=Paraburkholderia podalyriae TaxID=1938811 RepID=A0ABR7PTJ0_9BURK|nr:ABC transporter substrate-binding protein [Paraburkholderia podalyriae]MBC8749556.1 ABC transporter substrate-binding protein [Paraburkholderia podalyriae]
MTKRQTWLALMCAVLFQQPALSHADEVKVGLLGQFSGPYSWWGKEYQRGVDLFLDQSKGKVGNDTLTVVSRDEGGVNPQRTRQLAQELVVRDHVQYLFGTAFTPNALAVADVANQTKTPFLIGNSGTSSVTSKSPYFIRMGFTQWTVSVPLVQYAVSHGAKSAAIVVADYAPGQDAIDAYSDTLKKLGGTVAAQVRVPLGTTDFSSYLQRVSDAKPQAVLLFMPVGPMSAGFIKAFKDRGLDKSGITLLATTETMESDLPAIGDSALGLQTALHYSPYLTTPENQAFVAAYKAKYGKDAIPSIASVAAYDAMHVVAEMVKATHGQKDGDKAMATAKGLAWTSPRGPVSIDPKTREIVQNVYIRQVEKIDGVLGNKPIATYKAVMEPWYQAHPTTVQ